MHRDNIRSPEQLFLREQRGVRLGGAIGRQVLASGDRLHAERLADACHCATDIAEARHTECPPSHVVADAALPTASA
jgi:hypothetical protein